MKKFEMVDIGGKIVMTREVHDGISAEIMFHEDGTITLEIGDEEPIDMSMSDVDTVRIYHYRTLVASVSIVYATEY